MMWNALTTLQPTDLSLLSKYVNYKWEFLILFLSLPQRILKIEFFGLPLCKAVTEAQTVPEVVKREGYDGESMAESRIWQLCVGRRQLMVGH